MDTVIILENQWGLALFTIGVGSTSFTASLAWNTLTLGVDEVFRWTDTGVIGRKNKGALACLAGKSITALVTITYTLLAISNSVLGNSKESFVRTTACSVSIVGG